MNDSHPPKVKLRFGLRTLLVAVLIVGTAFGWLGAKLQRARKNRLAAAENHRVQGEIVMSGGEVEIQWLQFPNSLEVLFGDPGVSVVVAVRGTTAFGPAGSGFDDAVLKHVNELKELQRLCLARTAISDRGLRHVSQLTKLQSLSLQRTQVTDAGLEYLKGLTELEKLDVSYTCVTGAGANGLKKVLPRVTITPTPAQLRAKDEIMKLGGRLEWQRFDFFQTNESISANRVSLGRTKVTDAVLQHLKALPNLRSLDVSGTQVGDLGLTHLIGLTSLRKLDLQHTPVTDAGLKHLRGLTSLEELYLGVTQITDAGLVHLKGLTGLKSLFLNVTQVTDAGLVHLKELTNLQLLFLGGTGVTDAGLEHLRGLKRLRSLNVASTQVTREGVRRLREALPDCEIH